jgi:hypothetical protein
LLAAFTGSLAGSGAGAVAVAGASVAGVVVAVSLFGVSIVDASAGLDSAAGAVTISAGFGSGAFAVVLGAAAVHYEGKLMWDAAKGVITNNKDANRWVKPTFRKGWEIRL